MNRRLTKVMAIAFSALLVASGGYLGYRHLFGPNTISADFTTATAIYRGDQVRVAGVRWAPSARWSPSAPRPNS